MTDSDDDTLLALLRDPPRAPDPQFVLRTHRLIAVESMARQHRTLARRAWQRDLVAAGALVAGIPVSAWVFSAGHVSSGITQPLLAAGLCLWMLVHDWRMPVMHGLANRRQRVGRRDE